ncbi:hypothetical protein CTI12_AA170110 [Artemisia annua]|uniref:KIB1-4 beta-propeller domain-containing protein n=1 Tax=Artemisia annua TaxID=35608 RepID=A0A2U1PBQ5_ARTAN|nr:hypothetical protein CTI12_AA170110 [Artemisia annua]
MEQNQISCGPVYEQLPPLSAKYQWFVAQSPEADKDDTGDQFFYNIHEPLSYYRCRIPELLGKRIRGSFHGWLILSNDNMWSLWNPVSSKIICLPPLILKDGESAFIKECCLSLPPEDPKSILLLTRTDKPTFVFCRLVHKRKRLGWIEMSYDKQLKRLSRDGCLLHSLSCCNGKVYAVCQENCITPLVIEIDIVVKAGEVVIELLLFAVCPLSLKHCGYDYMYFLRGSNTELFCIIIAFNYCVETYDTTFSFVTLHKVDMSCINWAGLEGLKKWDISGIEPEGLEQEDDDKLYRSMEIWEEMEDLKDANFFVDLARDNSVAYSRAIASEFGGNIHIRSKMGKIIYSYNLNDGTILLNSMMPSPVLPASYVSVWECRLAGDYAKSKQGVEDKDRAIVVRLVTDDDVELNESQLLDLPLGVLEMIMKFCVGLEYLNFRATCKRCHLEAPVLQWRDEKALKRLQNYSLLSPWLMVVDKNRGTVTFEDPLSGYKYFMKSLPDQIDDAICYSGYGWLLFYGDYGLEFCNPFTNAVHDLPEVQPGFRFYWLCFSAPPTSPDCMVVGFGIEGIYIHFVGGEKSWRLVNLYALFADGELHVFKNLAQEDFSWEQDVVKAPRSWCRYPVEYFLTKCDQHLLLVFVDQFGESVEVFKLNDLKNEWEKTNGIGRHMIYISDSACLCRKAEVSEMENKIFFARLYNKNGKVVFYSLETGMYHTFNAKNIEESFVDFVGTKHYPFYHHAWIEPSWS